jgi:hypothetical protein
MVLGGVGVVVVREFFTFLDLVVGPLSPRFIKGGSTANVFSSLLVQGMIDTFSFFRFVPCKDGGPPGRPSIFP